MLTGGYSSTMDTILSNNNHSPLEDIPGLFLQRDDITETEVVMKGGEHHGTKRRLLCKKALRQFSQASG